jgi:hypothetical protein
MKQICLPFWILLLQNKYFFQISFFTMITEELSIIGITTTCKFPNALSPDVPGLLLYSDAEVRLEPGDLKEVPTGVQLCLPTGYWAEVRPIHSMTARRLDAKIDILETVSLLRPQGDNGVN